MRSLKIYFSAFLLAGIGFASCTKDFTEVNTNPNTLSAVRPESLLESAIYATVQANQNRALRLTHELMQVHVTTINSDEIHRYIIRPSESDYMWRNWYQQLTNFNDMYEKAAVLRPAQGYYASYMGMARIMEAWIFSLLTDTYGDVPFTEALQGRDGIYQPKFDAQKLIYDSLFTKFEEANNLLALNAVLPEALKPRDPLYTGDIVRWRKFGNSMYLRLLMRVAHKTELNAQAKIKEILETNPSKYPLMVNNDESAILRFTTTPPFVSAFNTFRDYDFNGDNGLSQFFINTLNAWEDPRRTKWATTVGTNLYEGMVSGYAPGTQVERLSAYQAALKNDPLLGNILNYPELQFMIAEAALRGYFNGNPKTFYENGVNNAITLWGLAVPTGHLAKPEIAWVEAESFSQKLEKIMTQKYFTLFFTDFQSWFEYRRTGLPNLPIGPGVQNNGEMPARMKYPVLVQALNQANYKAAVLAMGGDDINIKVWWQKP
jgi:hypothetical protein